MSQTPKETLDTILGYLGFIVEIEEQERDGQKVLQIFSNDQDMLVGKQEQVMDDLQYLLNRVLQSRDKLAPRVVVDVGHTRLMRDDSLVEKVRHMAEAVRQSGHSVQTEPLNSYDRRLVHNAFRDDPEITTWSPKDDARIKRITIKVRN